MALDNQEGIEVYYDQAFDTTPYDWMQDYETDMMNLPFEAFFPLLVEKLATRARVKKRDAEALAEALVEGKKRVQEGDYAMMFDADKARLQYYQRKQGRWELDEDLRDDAFSSTAGLTDPAGNACTESWEQMTGRIERANLKALLEAFDKKYAVSQEKLEQECKTRWTYAQRMVDARRALDQQQAWKYSVQQYKLGLHGAKPETADVASADVAPANTQAQVSPYAGLRDLLLGEPDMTQRQYDLLTFQQRYTRAASGPEESPYWWYCTQTNTPLLPTFLTRLASIFVADPSQYADEVEAVKREQGTLSDDEDAYVDKHSGYVIAKVAWSVDEGYDEAGFRLQSREVLERDWGETLLRASAPVPVPKKAATSVAVTEEVRIADNIVTFLGDMLGLRLESVREFIVRIALETTAANMMSRTTYETIQRELEKKGKKTGQPYLVFYHSYLLLTTVGMTLVAIQTHVPSLRTRKTFPGCVRSFEGFPIQGAGDDSAVQYLACLLVGIKKSKTVAPWNAIMGLKQESIATKLKELIQTRLVAHPDVVRAMEDKQRYLLQLEAEREQGGANSVEAMEADYALRRWTTCLPPLQRFQLRATQTENVPETFAAQLSADLVEGNPKQHERLLVLQSKSFFYSLGVQEAIQQAVDTKQMLLVNAVREPFVQNACCHEQAAAERTVMASLAVDRPQLVQYNQRVMQIENVLEDIRRFTEAATLFCPRNDKNQYPPVSQEYNEETIYRAFVVYCRFATPHLPVPASLVSVCMEKPETDVARLPLLEAIEQLKQEGRAYTNESLQRLLQLVGREQQVHVAWRDTPVTPRDRLYALVQGMRNESGTTSALPSRAILQLMKQCLELPAAAAAAAANDDRSALMARLQNAVVTATRQGKQAWLARAPHFLAATEAPRRGGRKRKSDAVALGAEGLLQKLDAISRTGGQGVDAASFLHTCLQNWGNVFPSLVHNKVAPKKSSPLGPSHNHWNLAPQHFKNLGTRVVEYYASFAPFYDDELLPWVLSVVPARCRRVLELATATQQALSASEPRVCGWLMEYYVFLVWDTYWRACEDVYARKQDAQADARTEEATRRRSFFRRARAVSETSDSASDTASDEGDGHGDGTGTRNHAYDDMTSSSSSSDEEDDEALSLQEQQNQDAYRSRAQRSTAQLWFVFLEMAQSAYDLTQVTEATVEDTVYRLKKREKDLLTDRLAQLTDAERKVDNELKKFKLGRWNKGLEKGLTQYVKEAYQENRSFADNMQLVEAQVRQQFRGQVTDQNMEQYQADLLEEEARAAEIEAEVNDLSGMDESWYDEYDPTLGEREAEEGEDMYGM